MVPGHVAPSAYAHGCAERFREIILSKTAFRIIFDPQNISAIQHAWRPVHVRFIYVLYLLLRDTFDHFLDQQKSFFFVILLYSAYTISKT